MNKTKAERSNLKRADFLQSKNEELNNLNFKVPDHPRRKQQLEKKQQQLEMQEKNVSSLPNVGVWTPLVNQDSQFGPSNTSPCASFPLLMTDGTIMVQNMNRPHTGEIWKLTPDIFGNYINGTWSQMPSLPIINGQRYSPLYAATAVLADGKVIIQGGEYDGPNRTPTWTSKGAIYDPVTNSWTSLPPPPLNDPYPQYGLGDAPCVVLSDGTYMVGNIDNTQAFLLDLDTLTWTETGTDTKDDIFCEAGLVLLPDGTVFTKNVYCFNPETSDKRGTEIYNPCTGNWHNTGKSITKLNYEFEMGPSVLRPDGTVFTVGANGNTGIYNWKTGEWSEGPTLPKRLSTATIPFISISSPNPVVGNYYDPQSQYYGASPSDVEVPSPFHITGNIVTTNPPNMQKSVPYAPLPPGSIALISWAFNDYDPNGNFDEDYYAVVAAAAAGAAGVIFYDLDGSIASELSSGWAPYTDGVHPSFGIDYELGQQFLANLNGLAGSLVNDYLEVQLGCSDASGVLLPNGNVLFMSAPSDIPVGVFGRGISVFEFNGTDLIEQPTVKNSTTSASYYVTALPLPTGQVLSTNIFRTRSVEVFTPADTSYNQKWAPKICSYPKQVKPGHTYGIKGYLFNGMSQAQNYGDDYMGATNYPLVRITNEKTGHVFYCKTHDHSYMGVANRKKKVYTYFDVPETWAGFPMETGCAIIEVVANGIPSKPKHINVKQNW